MVSDIDLIYTHRHCASEAIQLWRSETGNWIASSLPLSQQ
jgi:hypothetical protein